MVLQGDVHSTALPYASRAASSRWSGSLSSYSTLQFEVGEAISACSIVVQCRPCGAGPLSWNSTLRYEVGRSKLSKPMLHWELAALRCRLGFLSSSSTLNQKWRLEGVEQHMHRMAGFLWVELAEAPVS